MPKSRGAHCRLRTQRRAWGLYQREVAKLIGCRDRTHVSHLEHGARSPTLATALACELLFGVSVARLFPQVRMPVAVRLLRRVRTLYAELQKSESMRAKRVREILEACERRAKINSKEQKL